jgi:MerR family Zn(II)-responsive transcriptional regulator of zntA
MQTQSISVDPFRPLHVTELAAQAEVTPATVRYYSRVGLLTPGREPENGYRCFSSDDVRRVRFIRQAQALGLKIGDIKSILETIDLGKMPCHQVKSLVRERLTAIQNELVILAATKSRIETALDIWESEPNPKQDTGQLCPLIEQASDL